MRFIVSAHVTIEASSPERALANAQAIQKLLDEPMVKSVMQAQGIDVRKIQVFTPTRG